MEHFSFSSSSSSSLMVWRRTRRDSSSANLASRILWCWNVRVEREYECRDFGRAEIVGVWVSLWMFRRECDSEFESSVVEAESSGAKRMYVVIESGYAGSESVSFDNPLLSLLM